eukprot:CAMPEP_0182918662 /NCGR_PEP_ID=MMETSP0105_2-20130417/2235_1 /TAXON_ID=81532 ORGANISM="Acanthoeca-like sp., Strain 10tr" /NCGR_SAMPLE_ID=MMETSP0105_2 /ASSEMBLY_ACC=CAM_ASM_000205 /LENGTH=590 /DNA_ID=CAMNT_0025055777 /DNA_START=477 /DNA_END=2249 /DNA_ORIENTATION=+
MEVKVTVRDNGNLPDLVTKEQKTGAKRMKAGFRGGGTGREPPTAADGDSDGEPRTAVIAAGARNTMDGGSASGTDRLSAATATATVTTIEDEPTSDDWEHEISESESDSSSGWATGRDVGDSMRKPPTSHEAVPTPMSPTSPSLRRGSIILSPRLSGPGGLLSDDEDEANTQRERESIAPTELPRANTWRADSPYLAGSVLGWAPPRSQLRQHGLPSRRNTVSSGAGDVAAAVDSFVLRMARRCVPQDVALETLMQCGHSVATAEARLQKDAAAGEAAGRWVTASQASSWTEDEADAFDRAFVENGKEFQELSAAVGTKSLRECVDFYYLWKKTERGTAARRLRRDALSLAISQKMPRIMFVPISCVRYGRAAATPRKKARRRTPSASHSSARGATSSSSARAAASNSSARVANGGGAAAGAASAARPANPVKPVAPPEQPRPKHKAPPCAGSEDDVPGLRKRVRESEVDRSRKSRSPAPTPSAVKATAKRRRTEPTVATTAQRPLQRRRTPPTPPVRVEAAPLVVGDPNVFVVEAIVGTQMHKGRREYLVKWEGYGHQDNTWEPEENLMNNTILREWKRRKGLLEDTSP